MEAEATELHPTAAGGFLQVAVFVLFLGALFIGMGWYITDLRGGFRVEAITELPPVSAERGERIFWGIGLVNGTCSTCHSVGGRGVNKRGPDLGPGLWEQATDHAAKRREEAPRVKEDFTVVDYLVESMINPLAFVVEGYGPIMPAIHKPPVALEADHIKSLVLYLVSQDGKDVDADQITLPPEVTGASQARPLTEQQGQTK